MKTPSKYQQEIFKEYNFTNNNIFVSACPGSGKTTTSIELIKQKAFHKKAIMLAFNASIAKELKERVPNNGTETSTLHSLGMKLLRSKVSVPLKVNDLKTFIFGKKIFSKYLEKKYSKNEKDKNIHLFTLSKLINLVRMNNLNSDIDNFKYVNELFNVGADEIELTQSVQLFKHLMEYNEKRGVDDGEFIIDFTDMLYLTVKWLKPNEYPKYDEVFIDEVQDVNAVQKRLVDSLIKPTGRYIAVGDEKQTIYHFTGSTLAQLNEFKTFKNTTILPLSVSYRCSKKIIEEANKIFPNSMEASDFAEEGIVREGTLDEVREGDYIICRNNLPLVEKYIDLLHIRKKASIMGKDFGNSILNILLRIEKIENTYDILNEKLQELKEKGHPNPENSQSYQSLLEKIQIINILYSRTKSLNKLKEEIEKMFKDESNKYEITLCTAHKSKGLESNRVFWINKELFPSKYATSPEELYAEKCLEYVLITRAKKELIIVRTEQIEGDINVKMEEDVKN